MANVCYLYTPHAIRLPIANCVLLQKEGNRFRARHGMVLRSVQLPESLSR